MVFRRTIFILLIMLLAPVSINLGQQNPDLPALLEQLKKPHWDDRANALEELMRIPKVLQSAEVRDAIIALQEKENIYIRTEDPTTLGDVGGGEGYDDEYGTNRDETLMIIAERFSDSRAVSALAASEYNPDSQLGGWLADRKDAVSTLLKMVAYDDPIYAGNAAYVLATALNRDRHTGQKGTRSYKVMDDLTAEKALTLIRASLADTNPYKRDQVINALVLAGDASDLARLQKVAETDPSRDTDTGRYLQREHAQKAIKKLQTKIDQNAGNVTH